jgi:predicted nucleic acid-binding protein
VTVVADTSVLLSLTLLRQEGLLGKLFAKTLAPLEVEREFQRLAAEDTRFAGLEFPAFVEIQKADRPVNLPSAAIRLHAGEVSALILARSVRADFLLMDERAGRAVAAEMGQKTIGVLGLLIESKRRGLVASLEPLLDRLQREGGFWIAPQLRQFVLSASLESN